MEYFKKIKWHLQKMFRRKMLSFQVRNKPKIFCIGMNKTGTTSFKSAMEALGYSIGDQRRAERLLPEYRKNNFDAILNYCKTAQVFQDIPFSLTNTYPYLDQKFPKAKFILTVRDSPEQWYHSITKFHSINFGEGSIPSVEQLKRATYVYPSFMWEAMQAICNPTEVSPYDKTVLINAYLNYNEQVKDYFKNRSLDLLVINLAEKGSYQKLIDFLGITSPYKDFPWVNKTTEIVEKQ